LRAPSRREERAAPEVRLGIVARSLDAGERQLEMALATIS
jgi:hypothetical protein